MVGGLRFASVEIPVSRDRLVLAHLALLRVLLLYSLSRRTHMQTALGWRYPGRPLAG